MKPTADHVARAIIAACREVDADPVAVASGEHDDKANQGEHRLSRARAYAAVAIYDTFDVSLEETGLLCASTSPQVYLSTLRNRIKNKDCKWFNAGILARVVTAIGDVPERQRDKPEDGTLIPAAGIRRRRKPSYGTIGGMRRSDLPSDKRRLEDELRQAVLNTGGRLVEE